MFANARQLSIRELSGCFDKPYGKIFTCLFFIRTSIVLSINAGPEPTRVQSFLCQPIPVQPFLYCQQWIRRSKFILQKTMDGD